MGDSYAVVIPARYGSTRLPAKPLLKETGKYLIQHVYERARESYAECVVVATDDERIFQAVKSFGGDVVMTPVDCRSGTERCEAAAKILKLHQKFDVIVNVQGDEPLIDPELIHRVAIATTQAPSGSIVTAAYFVVPTHEDATNPSRVKVVVQPGDPATTVGDKAVYFSRSPIPHGNGPKLIHVGLYAIPWHRLRGLSNLRCPPVWQPEKLEQLAWLANGIEITVCITTPQPHGIDTPQDYVNFSRSYPRQSLLI